MNRTIIATATIIAVAAVAIFGLRTYTQATTAPSPVTVHDTDVNWDGRINIADIGLVASKYGLTVPPGGRPVAEQNLDANGNIKVHEQGGRVIPIGSVMVPTGVETPIGSYVDVSDCGALDAFVGASTPDATSSAVLLELISSIDGTVQYATTSEGNFTAGAAGVPQYNSKRFVYWNSGTYAGAPLVRISAYATGGGGSPTSVSLSLYCSDF